MSDPPANPSSLVLLRTFPTLFEADLARAKLAGADVPAVIANELSGGFRGMSHLAPRPFELLVPADLRDEAAAILDQAPDDPAEVAPPADDEVDPLEATWAHLRRSAVAGVAGLFLSGLVVVALPLFAYGLYLAVVRVVPRSREFTAGMRVLLLLAVLTNLAGLVLLTAAIAIAVRG